MIRRDAIAPGARRKTTRKRVLASLLLGGTMLAGVSRAQETSLATAPPPKIPVDAHGVDVTTGDFNTSAPLISIGPSGAGGLSVTRTFFGTGWRASYVGRVSSSGTIFTVNNGGATETFAQSGSTYTAQNGGASTLTYDGSANYTYTLADGTAITYSSANAGYNDGFGQSLALISQLKKPDGEIDTYTYETNLCTGAQVVQPGASSAGSTPASTGGTPPPASPPSGATPAATPCRNNVRLDQIASNTGYAINLSYAASGPNPGPGFLQLTGLVGVNTATSSSAPLPNTTLTTSGASTTVSNGFATSRYNYNTVGRITSIESPAGTTAATITYDASNRVQTFNDTYATYTYSYAASGSQFTTTVQGPTGNKVYVSNASTATVTNYTDELGRVTAYAYDGYGRLMQVTRPENDATQYAYDARGNVTKTTVTPKTGSSLANIVTQASYDTACGAVVKCNKPNYTLDALGYETDYVYDPTHGGPTSVTSPAAGVNNIRPQMRYGYTAYSTSNGSVYRLTSTSTCATASSCSGTSDETLTSITYGTNLLASSVRVAAGDSSVSATTTPTWSPAGDVTAIDGPLPGTVDVTAYRYGGAHQLLGVIGPDPDGAGSSRNRAQRYTYDGAGRLTQTDYGAVNSQSDADWANFVTFQQSASVYDAAGHKTLDKILYNGSTITLVQYTYESRGLLNCTAVRDPASNVAQLKSACQTMGSTVAGADRIAQANYDSAGQVMSRVNGVGTSDVATEFAATYGSDGEQVTATDANANVTTFEYDGFNRLSRIDFPGTKPTDPAVNAEVYGYDAASRRTSIQRRGGATVTDAYDALGNVTAETHPQMNGDANVANTWGNLGQLLKTSTNQGSGVNHSFGYDALGRMTTQTSVQGTVTTSYDAAGNRTRLTWPDGFYVTYDHDYTGETTAIRENGATSGAGVLEVFGYDDLGRRTSLLRGNGTSTSYYWDGISRFSSLTHTLSGSTQTEGVSYDASSEVATRTSSNDGWAWTGAYNVNRGYNVNGLNQPTTSGSNTLSWSPPGNLTSDSVTTYGYDSVNRLITTSTGKAAAYDGVGRMWSVGTPGNGTRFLYDGQEVIAEYNVSGTLLRRYVHGPGVDEPLVWYEGADTSKRSHLYADRQGSIVATAGDSGALTGINAYDEYGLPNGALAERFGYTGQKFLSEIGLYDYKARIYSPTLGRFLQPDPTGYGPGMNLYSYVSDSPVNGSDSTGLLPGSGVIAGFPPPFVDDGGGGGVSGGYGNGGSYGGGSDDGNTVSEVVVTGSRPQPTFLIPLKLLQPALFPPQSTMCAGALKTAGQTSAAVARANSSMSTLSQAASANGIDPALLAAIGVRETGFQNVAQAGGGGGMGVFQLTNQQGVTPAQAYNVAFAANYAAGKLSSNMSYLSNKFPSFTPSQLLQATAASYNFGTGNISGNPNTIDVGTSPKGAGNYGSNVVNLMSCFSH